MESGTSMSTLNQVLSIYSKLMRFALTNFLISFKLLTRIINGVLLNKIHGGSNLWTNSRLKPLSAKEVQHVKINMSQEIGPISTIKVSKLNLIME